MATAARTIAVLARDAVADSFVSNVGLKVVFANSSANDITQLGSNAVLVIVDVDSTDAHDRTKIVQMAEAAVYELRRQLFLKSKPSQLTTTTTTTYRPK